MNKYTFGSLGKLGRLGNQFFQVASTIGLATYNKGEYLFSEDWKPNGLFKNPLPTYEDLAKEVNPTYTLQEDGQDFVIPELDSEHNYNLFGYFQSEKYFKHCEDVVRNHFEPKEEILNYINWFSCWFQYDLIYNRGYFVGKPNTYEILYVHILTKNQQKAQERHWDNLERYPSWTDLDHYKNGDLTCVG